jgi:predicted Zn-dependent protease
MKKSVITILLLCHIVLANAQQPATVREYMQSFPTYAFSDPSPIPLLSPVYPYSRFDGFTDKAEQRQWKIVELQNDYIKVLITPEIGGKIWAAIEKRSGRPFIYYNHTVKFRDVAMRGPWTSGGLEANYGIIGHTPNCATPVDYMTRVNEDGSVSCIIGVLDLLSRSNWRVEINLPKDKAYFTTRSFWYNASPVEQPYYHWMNLGVKAKGNLEFIFPGNRYIGHGGEYADWPVNASNGKQINFYEQNNFGGYKSYHVFGKYNHFFGAYYHDDNNGMVRYGNYDDKPGKKIWIWGLSRQGMIWEKMLTDTDGQYVEIQSGRLFNQNADKSSLTPFKHIGFAPYNTDTWQEYWYPVGDINGMVEANPWGALNVKYEKGWLKLYFSAAQAINDSLKVTASGKNIYNKRIDLAPLAIFSDSLQVSINADSIYVMLGDHKLEYAADPAANLLKRPVEAPEDFDWSSAYGLYVAGKEYMDEKMYDKAEQKLSASLEKDHNFLPALVKMAALLYRNMRYEEALKWITRALSIDTESGEANYYYGLINATLGNIADAKDGFSIAALTPEYRSAAYTGLARIFSRSGEYNTAAGYALKALDFNRYNIDALMLAAVDCRYLHQPGKAQETLLQIKTLDPLNHFARFEQYLLDNSAESKEKFTQLIRNEMPAETFAELGVWYYNAGCINEAKQLFTMSPATAEAAYWLAFLEGRSVDCTAIDPDRAFPFRSETAMVIETLLKQQNDWLLRYHLALIYHDRNRVEECRQLLRSCADLPEYAPFYATRSMIFKAVDENQSFHDLQKAATLQPEQWRYQKMIVEYYNDHGQPEKALPVIESFYKAHPSQYIMGMLYAKTLMLNSKYREADKALSGLNIIPFEGATEGRALYREAKLMQAVDNMREKKYKTALNYIEDARKWPEHLGVGKPYDEDIDTRLEDWMQYLCYRQTGRSGDAALLQHIQQFTPAIDNTVRNFIPSNALVSAKVIAKTSGREKALQWLNEQETRFPETAKTLQWCKAMLENNTPSAGTYPGAKDAGMRILEALAGLGLVEK